MGINKFNRICTFFKGQLFILSHSHLRLAGSHSTKPPRFSSAFLVIAIYYYYSYYLYNHNHNHNHHHHHRYHPFDHHRLRCFSHCARYYFSFQIRTCNKSSTFYSAHGSCNLAPLVLNPQADSVKFI